MWKQFLLVHYHNHTESHAPRRNVHLIIFLYNKSTYNILQYMNTQVHMSTHQDLVLFPGKNTFYLSLETAPDFDLNSCYSTLMQTLRGNLKRIGLYRKIQPDWDTCPRPEFH